MTSKHRIFTTSFASVYPLYLAKAERKGRTKSEGRYDGDRAGAAKRFPGKAGPENKPDDGVVMGWLQ